MLILTRKRGQSVCIELGNIDPCTPVGEVFADGPIRVLLVSVQYGQIKLGIEANSGLLILRSELSKID